MKRLLLMISFFTRIPVGSQIEYSDELYRKSVKLFPLIGIIIGLVLILPMIFLNQISNGVRSILVILTYLLMTGGLHLDGLADSMDGLFSNRPKDRIFEIMKDSRIGSFGVIGLILYFLIFYQMLLEVSITVVFLMPFVGKSVASFVAGFSKYAKKEPGMGSIFMESHDAHNSMIVLLINLIIGYLLAGFTGLSCVGLTFLFGYNLKNWIENKIEGMTGDTIGLMVEVSQMFFLLISGVLTYIFF